MNRQLEPSKACLAVYDPYVYEFDGGAHHTTEFKPSYMMNTVETTVVMNEVSCPVWNGFCISNIGIRHYDSFFTAQVNNLGGYKLSQPTDTSLIKVTVLTAGTVYSVTLADNTVIILQAIGSLPQINTRVTVPGSYKSRTTGQCGNFNGIANDESWQLAYGVATLDNLFACPGANATHAFKGCTSYRKPWPNSCTRESAPSNFCDAAVASMAINGPVQEEVYQDDSGSDNIVVSNSVSQFQDVSVQQTSTSSSSRRPRSSITSKSYVIPSGTATAVVEPVFSQVDSATPVPQQTTYEEVSAPDVCYDTIPHALPIQPLGVAETDAIAYCLNQLSSYQCLDSMSPVVLCQEITTVPLTDATSFAANTLALLQISCASEVSNLLNSFVPSDRVRGHQLASEYNIRLTAVNCSDVGRGSPDPIIVENVLQRTPSSTSQKRATSISVGGESDVTSQEVVTNDSSSSIVIVGLGSAAAVIVLGVSAAGLIMARRKRTATNFSDAVSTSSNASLYSNPVYSSNTILNENRLYVNPDSRRRSSARNKV